MAQISNAKPKADDPAAHAFPALGSSYERKVEVAWNQYYDCAGLGSILARLNKAFPKLTKLYSIGKSHQGRDLWCLEVTAPGKTRPGRKPGNVYRREYPRKRSPGGGSRRLHGVVSVPPIWETGQSHGLARPQCFLPRADHQPGWSGSLAALSEYRQQLAARARIPEDNDRDGLVDEDDVDDLDGDGAITQMRIRDPQGRWKPHPHLSGLPHGAGGCG